MSVQSYSALHNSLQSFSDNHLGIQRFELSFFEQLPNFSTNDVSFPILYAIPNDVSFGEYVNTYSLRIYVVDLIQKDRSNVDSVLNSTLLTLRDLYNWLKLSDNDLNVLNSPRALPVNNFLMDYTVGWYYDIDIEVETENNDCSIPFLTVPSGSTNNCASGNVTITNSTGQTLTTVSVPSGGVVIESLPDVDNVDSTGTVVPTPAGVPFVATAIDSSLSSIYEFGIGDDLVTEIVHLREGYYTGATTTNCTISSIEIDEVVTNFPFTLVESDEITIHIIVTNPALPSQVILNGAYVPAVTLTFSGSSYPSYASTLATTFNGTNQYLDLGSGVGNFSKTNPFSLVFRVQSNVTPPSAFRGLLGKYNPSKGWYIDTFQSSTRFIFAISSNNYIAIRFQAVGTTKEHLFITYDGSQLASGFKVYKNGVELAFTIDSDTMLSGVDSSQNTITTNPLWVARRYNGVFSNMRFDELLIFDKKLTDAEVTSIYNGGIPKNESYRQGITNWYKLGEGDTDSDIIDSVGSADGLRINGTVANMVVPITYP